MKKLHSLVLLSCLFFLVSACQKNDVSPSSESGTSSQSGTGGSLARSTIVNNTMYFVDNSTMQVYDLSTKTDPKLINKVQIFSSSIETIYALDNYLYLGSSNGMFIYDISSKFNPRYLSMATHASGCDPVVSDGKYAYVTVRNTIACNRMNSLNILAIYDVTNPTSPKEISNLSLIEPIGLAIDGNNLFVCDKGAIKIIDVSNKNNPKIIKSIISNAYDIIINKGNIITVGNDGITQYEYNSQTLELIYKSKIQTVL